MATDHVPPVHNPEVYEHDGFKFYVMYNDDLMYMQPLPDQDMKVYRERHRAGAAKKAYLGLA